MPNFPANSACVMSSPSRMDRRSVASVSAPPLNFSRKVMASDFSRLRRGWPLSVDMGCHLFDRHELNAAVRANFVDRPPLAAESYGPLASSLPLQGFIVEAGHPSGCFQPILLDGFDPCHEFRHDVSGSPSKLPTCSFRDDSARDHDRIVALSGLLVNGCRWPTFLQPTGV